MFSTAFSPFTPMFQPVVFEPNRDDSHPLVRDPETIRKEIWTRLKRTESGTNDVDLVLSESHRTAFQEVYLESTSLMLDRSSFSKNHTFHTLPREEIAEIVRRVCIERDVTVDAEEIGWITRLVETNVPGRTGKIASEFSTSKNDD